MLVDGRGAVADDAVDRHLLAGAHAQPVADRDLGQRHVALAAVGSHDARELGREVHERADGIARAVARFQLQHLADEHQHDDDGGGLEVDVDEAAVVAHRRGEQARRQRGDEAVEERRRHAEADQCPHVGGAIADRGEAAFEERAAAPQHDRRREQQLQALREARTQPAVDGDADVRAHGDGDERYG